MLYFLSETYAPNTAVTNHTMAFIRGFSELGLKGQWVFLMNNDKNQCCELDLSGIDYRYLWTEFWSRNKYIKHLYKQFAYARFYFSLRPGDTVVLFGMSAYIPMLTKRKGIKVYHERTEHPDAVRNTRYKLSLRNYFESCQQLDGLFVISDALRKYFVAKGVEPENTDSGLIHKYSWMKI